VPYISYHLTCQLFPSAPSQKYFSLTNRPVLESKMLKYNGIVEITGKKGSGRTNIVLKESQRKGTLFISVKPLPINRYTNLLAKKYGNKITEIDDHLNNTFILIINKLERLEAFILYKLNDLVKKHGISLIVLYEIDFLLLDDYVEMDSIFCVMNKLHEIKYNNRLDVVFVTLYRKVFSHNYNIRLSMEYFINERYQVSRRNDARKIVHVNYSNNDVFNVLITDDDVIYVRKQEE
ncbi:hypothetical protein THOM_0525, partial [Trachipleistophora hominis]